MEEEKHAYLIPPEGETSDPSPEVVTPTIGWFTLVIGEALSDVSTGEWGSD